MPGFWEPDRGSSTPGLPDGASVQITPTLQTAPTLRADMEAAWTAGTQLAQLALPVTAQQHMHSSDLRPETPAALWRWRRPASGRRYSSIDDQR